VLRLLGVLLVERWVSWLAILQGLGVDIYSLMKLSLIPNEDLLSIVAQLK